MRKVALTVMLIAAFSTTASAQLLIPESSNDQVMLFDQFDGSLINPSFIDLSTQDAGTPINAVVAGGEIWVTDQIRDKVTRWSLDGTTYLGAITGAMDNIRGLEVVGSKAYISSSGTNNGAPGEAVVIADIPTATLTGDWFHAGSEGSGDPFDVLDFDGRLLVNDIDDEDIDLFDYDGTFIQTFHDSDGINGIDFSEQMALSSDGVLSAGFSSPAGIYEYDNDGNQINYWDVGSGNRGVYELGNGNILFTSGDGVFILNPDTGGVTPSYEGVSARFIDPIPEPATLMLLGLAGLMLRRR